MWIACWTVFGWKFMEHLPKLAEWMDYEPVITRHVTPGLPANRLGRMKALSGGRVGLGDHDHGSDASGKSPAPYGTRRSCEQRFANALDNASKCVAISPCKIHLWSIVTSSKFGFRWRTLPPDVLDPFTSTDMFYYRARKRKLDERRTESDETQSRLKIASQWNNVCCDLWMVN